MIAKDPKSAEIIKPILRGRDIKKYQVNFADLWLIATHNGFKDKNGKKIEIIYIEDYPAIKKHLDKYWDKISKRCDKGITPYNLRNCAYYEEFEKEKIVYPCIMGDGPRFYFDKNLTFPPAPANIITGNSIKYLISFLNSKLMFYSLQTFYMGGGIKNEFKTNNIEKIPIPKISPEKQKSFEKIGEQILLLKKAGKDTQQLEDKIDLMVYKLYELTYAEVKIVDPDFLMSEEEYESYEF
ncbi:MAG: TaqI-like C-terminal specificity domain-containing protein [Candidatus Marinimicrobia bacterium]|nr:TaqI-like C-terminal specificity domain-containing protein [Candidatus Neomarinimicrobiota bacterium]